MTNKLNTKPRNPLVLPMIKRHSSPQIFSDTRREDLENLEKQEALQELSNDNDLEDPKETETIYEE